MGCHALLQGIFPIQGSNPYLLQSRQILYPLSHLGGTLVSLTPLENWLRPGKMDTVQTLFKILLLLARALDRPIKCVCVCVCARARVRVCVGAGKGNALVPYKSLP